MFIPQKDFFRFIKKCWYSGYSYLGTHPLNKKSLGIFKFSGLEIYQSSNSSKSFRYKMYKNLIINAVAIVPSRVKAKNNVDQAKTNAIGDPNGP